MSERKRVGRREREQGNVGDFTERERASEGEGFDF